MVDAIIAVMIWFTLVHPHLERAFSVSTQLNQYLTGADSSMSHIMNMLQIELTGYNSFVQNEALKVMPFERQKRVIIEPQRQVRLKVIVTRELSYNVWQLITAQFWSHMPS